MKWDAWSKRNPVEAGLLRKAYPICGFLAMVYTACDILFG